MAHSSGDDDLLADAAARAVRYRRTLDDRPVMPGVAELEAVRGFVERLPDEGASPGEVIEMLDELGSPGTVASTGGRYFGFVTGSSYPVATAASWLATTWDQNSALGVMSPVASVLDSVAGAWLADVFGIGAVHHSFVSGTSVANAVCLAAGRDRLLSDAGWDAVENGLFGAPPLRIVVSDAAHASVTKALGFVGLGRSRVTAVASDDQGRLDPAHLPEADEPTLVILQAGNVNSGSFDPFDAVADHFDGTPHWIHVDGAFGLWAATNPGTAHLTAGMDRAHSWATDMHKWLNVPYDSASVFVRDGEDLARTFMVGASYLGAATRLEPMHRGPQMSQRARAIETWAVLKTLGRSGLADLIDRSCGHARAIASGLSDAGLTICNDVVLNQVLVADDTDARTEALVARIGAGDSVWAGGSVWRGRPVMRVSVSSYATAESDVTTFIDAVVRARSDC